MNFISAFNELNNLFESVEAEAKVTENELKEEAEIEEVEEAVAEEPTVEDSKEEIKQLVLECSKCGALVIKDEADVVMSDDSSMVNVEEVCKFCEEAAGYEVVGTLAPYVAEETEEDIIEIVDDEEAVEEGLLDLDVPISTNVNIKADGNNVPVLSPGA